MRYATGFAIITGVVYAAMPALSQNSPVTASLPSSGSPTPLATYRAALRAATRAQGLNEDINHERFAPIVSSQTYSPIELYPGRNLSGSGTYYFASKDGRDMEISEWVLGGRISPKIGLWFGHQAIVGKGRTLVPQRSNFHTQTSRFGFRAQIMGSEARGLSLQYDGYHSAAGTAIVGNSVATLPGPKTDVLTLHYTRARQQEYSDIVALPGYRFKLSVANVQGIGAGAVDMGGGGGITFKVARHLYGDADLLGVIEARRGNVSGAAFRSQMTAALTYQPASWIKLQTGLEIFPFGVPFGGHPLSGLSSFGVYQRNDGVSGFSNGLVAALSFRLEVGYRF